MNKPILSALAIVYVLIWSSGSYAQPVITSVGPPSGGIGTVVTIHGTNFVNTTAVSFNEVSAANYNVVGGGTVINAEVAAGTTTGPVTITATDGTATSTMDFVVSDIPKITRVDPPSGGIGTVVTIHGINFVNTTAVSFNGIAAAIYSVVSAGTAIIAEVAVDTTTGPITITTADGTVTSTKDFVFSDVPTITSFDPPSGGVGTLVTIHGANFANATAVFFNNVPAANYSDIGGGAVIVAEVAAGTTTGPVTITATDGTATSAMDFVFSDSPTINSFDPPSGEVGTLVIIRGTNLANATAVSFNDVPVATYAVVGGGTVINAEVAEGTTTGPVAITTPDGTVTSTMDFVFSDVPTIASFNPPNGGRGSEVTIHGTNFANTTAVSFNDVLAATYAVIAGGTIINAEVAAGTTTGPVTVATPEGTATSTMDFVVSNVPTITDFDPADGGIGTVVTIHGTNFSNATAVSFNNVSAATYTVVAGGTIINAVLAVGTTTGPVTVTTPEGTATSTMDFAVDLPADMPIIKINPKSDSRCIEPNRNQKISVGILGNRTFKVTNINVDTLTFDSRGLRISSDPGANCFSNDVNGDGTMDLFCDFQDSLPWVWLSGNGEGIVTGEFLDGTKFQATGSMCVLPSGKS